MAKKGDDLAEKAYKRVNTAVGQWVCESAVFRL